ncbi:molybdopterin biosynthesis protein MoeY [Roseateles sp.]|uniref:molybdopterin biosynthesis protein MoeY n=1 Tax=Roseateles sp. TaxID=1971397 RepID=UPI003925A7CD
MLNTSTLHSILDLARWAPSGDNTQPWRFELTGDGGVVIHGFDTRTTCVYDLDGHASQISVGAMLETLSIAATQFGLRAIAARREHISDERPTFDVRFVEDASLPPDPLAPYIQQRRVQRQAMQTTPLGQAAEKALEASVGEGFTVVWRRSLADRARLAKLLFHSAKIRLICPEAYEVHRDVIEWNCQFSNTKIPDQALGADPASLRLMRFAMVSWQRVSFLNRYFAGTWVPRIQLDALPALRCGTHFAITARQEPQGLDDYIAIGRQTQRFWLTATKLGLQIQPQITPLVFSRYANAGRRFTTHEPAIHLAVQVAAKLNEEFGPSYRRIGFMGRIGSGKAAESRSLRRPLEELLISGEPTVE